MAKQGDPVSSLPWGGHSRGTPPWMVAEDKKITYDKSCGSSVMLCFGSNPGWEVIRGWRIEWRMWYIFHMLFHCHKWELINMWYSELSWYIVWYSCHYDILSVVIYMSYHSSLSHEQCQRRRLPQTMLQTSHDCRSFFSLQGKETLVWKFLRGELALVILT